MKKIRNPKESRRKKQRYMAKQQKQNATIITKQIDSEAEQIHWQETNTTESVKKKLMVQFGFVANPSHSSRHNSSTVLANTPTWYYFSRPSHLAFHDFTKKVKPQKNLRSLLGLGLKFIPTPTLTNSWTRLRTQTYHRLFWSVHLRFHFAGKPPDEDSTTYDPKMYVHSKWTPPHWTIPPVALEERLSRFSNEMGTLLKTQKGKPTYSHINNVPLTLYNSKTSSWLYHVTKTLGPPSLNAMTTSKSQWGTICSIRQHINY